MWLNEANKIQLNSTFDWMAGEQEKLSFCNPFDPKVASEIDILFLNSKNLTSLLKHRNFSVSTDIEDCYFLLLFNGCLMSSLSFHVSILPNGVSDFIPTLVNSHVTRADSLNGSHSAYSYKNSAQTHTNMNCTDTQWERHIYMVTWTRIVYELITGTFTERVMGPSLVFFFFFELVIS